MKIILELFKKYYGILKYIISGGSAACVNLGVLYILTEFIHFHYLQSAVLSFTAAFFVSFLLQKFWTFRDTRKEVIHWQMVGFLTSSLINLLLNTLLIFLFVEIFHVWYLLAALFAGALLAVASFFVYRHVIFKEHKEGTKLYYVFSWIKKHFFSILLVGALGLGLFLGLFRLTESPPTWLDEGIIIQTAINNATQGFHAALQSAPGVFESAGYVSTSYPATYPVALSFSLFGVGLLQARAVMVLFIALSLLVAYALLKKETTTSLALLGLFLLTTFAPLYGNGKNVLGEIPGLLYLLAFLWFVRKIEQGKASLVEYLAAGALLGLAVATKPIFLLLLPVVGVVFLLSLKLFSLQKIAATIAGFVAPIWVWVVVQFNGETLAQMFAIYANPHANDFTNSLLQNALGFITHPQPLYALCLLFVWLAAVAVRISKKQPISRAEYIAVGFAVLVFAAYLRGAEYYRYFFLGEVLALLYLPKSIKIVWPKQLPETWFVAPIALLLMLQLYQCFFNSWIADHYTSTRSQSLTELALLTAKKSVLVYQTPEAVVFLPNKEYYQYFDLEHVAILGQQNIAKLEKGEFDMVLIPQANENEANLSHYTRVAQKDRYSLWAKK